MAWLQNGEVRRGTWRVLQSTAMMYQICADSPVSHLSETSVSFIANKTLRAHVSVIWDFIILFAVQVYVVP